MNKTHIRRYVPRWLPSAVKFGGRGGAGVLANIALLTIIVDIGGVPPEWGVFVAWAVTLVPGYLVTDKFVFAGFPSPDSVGSHGQRGALHYLVMWTGKAANYLVYYLLLGVPWMPYQLAWVLGAIVVFPYTFGGNYVLWKWEVTWHDVAARVPVAKLS